MSIVNYSFIGQKFQLKKNKQRKHEGFMLMEMVVGIFIFLATLFVGYSYLAMSSRWSKTIQMHAQAVDMISSLFETKQLPQTEDFIVQSYYYAPQFVQHHIAWDASVSSVTVTEIKRIWSNDEGKEYTVALQTAY